MATSWGIDPLKDIDGNVTIGTSAADFRQIQGGLFTPGLISGGLVTRSASAMTYTVSAGVAAFPIVTGSNPQTVLGPIPSATVNTTAPTSGTRIDVVYARQRTVGIEGDPNIVIEVGPSLPANSVLLDSFIVSYTNTNTNATVRQGNIKYSIPYGASLGLLANRVSTFSGNFTVTATDVTGSFYLPTDRLVRVTLTTSLSASGAYRFDNAKYCEAGYDFYFDDLKYFAWSSQGLHQAWAETSFTELKELSAGVHTYKTVRYRAQGPGTCVARNGARLQIQDVGPIV